MNKKLHRKICIIACFVFIVQIFYIPVGAEGMERFSDIPVGHWADDAVHQLRLKGITDGIGNNQFGLGMPIKRDEFVAFLSKLMKWELANPEKGSFIDNLDKNNWYYSYIETAVQHGVVLKDSSMFRPEEPITREEMAIMIVRCLGYDNLAKNLAYLGSPFEDVTRNTGYITIVKDMGIVSGTGGNKYSPEETALREQAAAIMVRMYEKLNKPLEEMNGFYAIKSYQQKDFINNLTSVSFGWSRLEYDSKTKSVVLNTTSGNGNMFAVPDGFEEPFNIAREKGVTAQLMVFAENDLLKENPDSTGIGFLEYIFANPGVRQEVADSIAKQVNSTTRQGVDVSFDGVVVDFEGLKGKSAAEGLNVFLKELKQKLLEDGKKLYIAVHPQRRPGLEYFDGYDYKTIGELADKVILMAHDYEAKSLTANEMKSGYVDTPLAPIDEIYYALRAITDKDTGVEDVQKIMLQISFGSAQWKTANGAVINQKPYTPEYEAIMQRIKNNASMYYSELSESPYIKFYDDNDQTDNIVWYEDARSIKAKIKLAGMFGIQGISIWRLGIVPDYNDDKGKDAYLDVWNQLINAEADKSIRDLK